MTTATGGVLRLGIAGCGRIASEVHLPLLRGLDGVRVAAVAEPDAALRARAAREAPGARLLDDYRALVDLPDVDAVIVCLPPTLHAPAAVAAFEAGKPVYLEKPLAASREDGADIISAWRRSRLVGMIGFNYRANPLIIAAKRRLEEQVIGQPLAFRSVFSTHATKLAPWEASRASGGGVLLSHGSHHVDLIRFLFGRGICGAFAELASKVAEQDTAVLQLQLEGGLFTQSFFSTAASEEDRFEIIGERGVIAIDRYRSVDVGVHGVSPDRLGELAGALRRAARLPYLLEKSRSPWHEPSYRAALTHFVQAVQRRERASPDLMDGWHALEGILAAERSAASTCRVPLDMRASLSR